MNVSPHPDIASTYVPPEPAPLMNVTGPNPTGTATVSAGATFFPPPPPPTTHQTGGAGGEDNPPPTAAHLAYEAATKAMKVLGVAEGLDPCSAAVPGVLAIAEGYRHLADTLAERGHAIVAPRPTNGPVRATR